MPRAVDAVFGPEDTSLVLDRQANQATPTAGPSQDGHTYSSHAITATRLNQPAGSTSPSPWVIIQADGVRIVDASRASAGPLVAVLAAGIPAPHQLKAVDLMLMPAHADAQQLAALAQHLAPRIAVLAPGSGVDQVGSAAVVVIGHNTVAVSAGQAHTGTRWVQPNDQAWAMPAALAQAFERKEAANAASQAVFAPLSIAQMDFVPGNGTHTPRWNPEHMDATERLFFSRIYHSVDPEIPVMDQRPKQMPDQYTPAHPQWIGAEEARHMQRTQAYSRRFAYLLEAPPTVPDTPASIRRNRLFKNPLELLALMHRHYGEHTAHVKKKMALDHWPAQ